MHINLNRRIDSQQTDGYILVEIECFTLVQTVVFSNLNIETMPPSFILIYFDITETLRYMILCFEAVLNWG